ncbi:MAG TPA: hypothetical protein VGD50_07040 [Candidatus Baltobacteraceae bacterium]
MNGGPWRRFGRGLVILVVCVGLSACREVRVNEFRTGTTTIPGSNQVIVVSDPHEIALIGIPAPEVNFKHEFGVALLMGPHHETGCRQVIESIRANGERVRILAYERAPADGGEPALDYRTYTLWIVPRSVYHPGSVVEVVTPSGEPVASTVLR